MLQALMANMAAMQEQMTAMQAQAVDAAAALEAAEKVGFDKGFVAGVASVGGDKIYSQAEMDAKILEIASSFKEKVAMLEAQIAENDAKMAQAVADAVAAAKAEIMAKLQEIDAMEDAKIAEIFQ